MSIPLSPRRRVPSGRMNMPPLSCSSGTRGASCGLDVRSEAQSMSVVHLENLAETVIAPEAKVRFVHGESMTVAYWSFTPSDFQPPPHSQCHEQLIQVPDGSLEVWIDGTSTILGPGSVALVAAGKPHWARAVTDCRVLDIFHPVREDYRSGNFAVIQA